MERETNDSKAPDAESKTVPETSIPSSEGTGGTLNMSDSVDPITKNATTELITEEKEPEKLEPVAIEQVVKPVVEQETKKEEAEPKPGVTERLQLPVKEILGSITDHQINVVEQIAKDENAPKSAEEEAPKPVILTEPVTAKEQEPSQPRSNTDISQRLMSAQLNAQAPPEPEETPEPQVPQPDKPTEAPKLEPLPTVDFPAPKTESSEPKPQESEAKPADPAPPGVELLETPFIVAAPKPEETTKDDKAEVDTGSVSIAEVLSESLKDDKQESLEDDFDDDSDDSDVF